MRGELLWFNEARQDGLIGTEHGEQLVVLGQAFPGGTGPVGRCAGTLVTFNIADAGGERTATAVAYAPRDAARRARRRPRR